MKWFKKKVVAQPRKIKIPDKHVLELLALVDEYNKLKTGQDNVALYNLWSFIEKILTEDLSGTTWRISKKGFRAVYIVEKPKEVQE